jgi:TonB-dependent starch-binding outer membrane protein SusC
LKKITKINSKQQNMRKSFLYSLLFLAGILSNSILQGQTLRGVLSDKVTGETLPGANIMVEGTTQGTVTNLNGEYILELTPGNFRISYSFIGYIRELREISLSQGQTLEINISLSPDIATFEELVVIGYGTQKKKVATGAIASVSSDDISSLPVLRADQALQGRTAGVQVTNLSGQPGEAPTIRVRGVGTTGNSEPLYVVDGMVMEGGIGFLNPGDIESIDVLKDAASAAIYGARAANGVVLVTTKTGKAGRMDVTFSSYTGIQNVARKIELLNADQYRMMMNEGARNAGATTLPFPENQIFPHDTDWQAELFTKNAPITNYELSVNGGGEKSTYASSLAYFAQQGIIGGEKSQFERISGRFNSRHEVTSFFTFGNHFSYSHMRSRGIASNTSFNGAYSSALNLDPLTPLFEENQNILNQPPYSNNPVLVDSEGRVYGISRNLGSEIVNPVALLEIQTGRYRGDHIVGNVFGELKIIEGLVFKSSFGVDLAYATNSGYRPLFYLNEAQNNADYTSVNRYMSRAFVWQFENTLSYAKQIDGHNFNFLVGTTANKGIFDDLYGFNAGVPITDPNHVYLNMATDTLWDARGGADHWSLLSQFGRVLYDWNSKYAVNFTIRRDGSSVFGPNNRYGIFPSVGATWIISEEEFFPSLGPVDIIKLRASWGVNGNDRIGRHRFVSVMDKSRGYIFGGGRAFGVSPQFVPNEDIRWEESEQINIAIDAGAFDNRLTVAIDYYVKNTNGLLEVIPIPGHIGNAPPVSNVGSVQNKGVELMLNWRNYAADFRYSFGLNAAYNKNKMTVIGNEEGVIPGATWAVAGFVTRTEVGLPIAHFYGYVTDGIFQNQNEIFSHIGSTGQVLQPNAKPGDVRFVDVNGDGRITPDDRTMIGKPTPDWTLGFNANFEYKQFDLAFLLTGTYGNDIFNGMHRQDLPNTNRTIAILDRWTGEGTSNTIPRFTFLDVNNNYRISDLYVEDGSYLRLKNIQIGYTIPRSFLNRIKANTWRFYISAENLFTLTNYTGTDPEIGALSSFDIGIDRGVYPQARTFRLGTTISF